MSFVIYQSITLHALNLFGNQFLNFFILAIIEIPAGVGGMLCNRWGRRWTQVIFYMMCFLFSVGAGAAAEFKNLGKFLGIFSVISAVIAK